jgi:FKBP12-rapamycin complex-associated protein
VRPLSLIVLRRRLVSCQQPDGTFFKALLNLHKENYEESHKYINRTRELLDTELRALVGESYNRAYKVVVKVQQLSEMEEVINYKQSMDVEDRKAMIRTIWTKRLKGCQRNVEVWQVSTSHAHAYARFAHCDMRLGASI